LSWQIEPEALSILVKLNQFLTERQIQAYVVGGFVRDMLLERPTADIDIAIASDVFEIAPQMSAAFGGKFVVLDASNQIARVVLFRQRTSSSPNEEQSNQSPVREQWYIDLSSLPGGIEADLGRRDFSIDAIAIELKSLIESPSSFRTIDPFEGQADLRRKSLKAVKETVFEEDPVRLLRAVRLAAELGFSITEETENLMRRFFPLISRVAGERIREEFLRLLATPEAGRSMRYLDTLGLLTGIIPELEPTRGVDQPREHHWDVLNHSLETVRAAEFLLRQGKWEYGSADILNAVPWSEKLHQHFATEVSNGSTHASLLKFAALLHDISKPETRIIADNRLRFFGHTEQGALVATAVLERLRFSNKEIKLIELMVRYHLRPTQMSHEGMPTQRAVYRYFRDTGDASIDILFLSLADHLAARGPELELEQWKWHSGQVNYLLTECLRQESVASPPKLLDGHDLIEIFGLKPGPEIREILESLKETQAAGEVTTRDEALYYVKNRLLYREQKLS
jgi:poly(A) polymerase